MVSALRAAAEYSTAHNSNIDIIELPAVDRATLNFCRVVARSHGWSLYKIPVLDLSAVENPPLPEAQTTVFHPSEVELTKISQLLLDEVRKAQPARVAFDSLSEFRLTAETALRYRRQLLTLKQQFGPCQSTVLLQAAPSVGPE